MKPVYRRALYPSQGFRVNLPDGRVLEASSFEGLVGEAQKALSVSPLVADEFVNEKLCEQYPAHCSSGVVKTPANLAWLTGEQLARVGTPAKNSNPEERLDVCKKCPRNAGLETPGCCGVRSGINASVKANAARLGVPAPFGSGFCGATGWPVSFVATLDLPKILPDDTVHELLPENCPLR